MAQTKYSPLPAEEEEFREKFLLNRRKIRSCIWGYISELYIVALHFTVITLAALLFLSPLGHHTQPSKLLPSEIPFAEGAVQYETVIFDPSGFSEGSEPATPFEGAPNPENNAMWDHLTNVGIYSLTAKEYAQLPLETAQVVGEEDQYIVTIEMFHQLHCLNYLRQRLYHSTPHHAESEDSKPKHLSHCIDYLRQVLMCHGDLSMITLVANSTRSPPYSPDFKIKHTCRNFDSIWNFAAERNISGLTVE